MHHGYSSTGMVYLTAVPGTALRLLVFFFFFCVVVVVVCRAGQLFLYRAVAVIAGVVGIVGIVALVAVGGGTAVVLIAVAFCVAVDV